LSDTTVSPARVLLIDNYDSFTWNVVQGLGRLGAQVEVHRNDALDLDAAARIAPTHLVISPGPGRPEAAGISVALLRAWVGRLPILGICLGHQALAAAFGGEVIPAARLVHGKSSAVTHDATGVFAGLPAPMVVGRYHSLAVSARAVPAGFRINAHTLDADAEVMGLQHETLPVAGVQFHPESVLTPDGQALLANFLRWR
jgi:anthranilate synthase/aminodeoxychorismate synthase-like glutamine amidotransferase